MTTAMPAAVAKAFDAFPPEPRALLLQARETILQLADETKAGPMTETLKWGEPAYLTEQTKAGSTIRLGLVGGQPAVLFHCQTTLVDSFRTDLPDAFDYSGNRALILAESSDPDALALCLTRALTYHRAKRAAS
ncbi:DUF1801 domain-containing protein [Pseudoruegeria sp. HB172150]|uniref:DUF1801 domain-containing protein n=1 Tax=Pseudoruegeria sp. HB172150 TaxID=2721164 RepID=UPI001551A6F1|nr:DUF1801 domain-containing protein [Pseudoruegeria sp. HB172150]